MKRMKKIKEWRGTMENKRGKGRRGRERGNKIKIFCKDVPLIFFRHTDFFYIHFGNWINALDIYLLNILKEGRYLNILGKYIYIIVKQILHQNEVASIDSRSSLFGVLWKSQINRNVPRTWLIALMMEAVVYETIVSFHQTIWRSIPEIFMLVAVRT